MNTFIDFLIWSSVTILLLSTILATIYGLPTTSRRIADTSRRFLSLPVLLGTLIGHWTPSQFDFKMHNLAFAVIPLLLVFAYDLLFRRKNHSWIVLISCLLVGFLSGTFLWGQY